MFRCLIMVLGLLAVADTDALAQIVVRQEAPTDRGSRLSTRRARGDLSRDGRRRDSDCQAP